MIRRRNAAIEREKRLYKMNYWGVGRGMGERGEGERQRDSIGYVTATCARLLSASATHAKTLPPPQFPLFGQTSEL